MRQHARAPSDQPPAAPRRPHAFDRRVDPCAHVRPVRVSSKPSHGNARGGRFAARPRRVAARSLAQLDRGPRAAHRPARAPDLSSHGDPAAPPRRRHGSAERRLGRVGSLLAVDVPRLARCGIRRSIPQTLSGQPRCAHPPPVAPDQRHDLPAPLCRLPEASRRPAASRVRLWRRQDIERWHRERTQA